MGKFRYIKDLIKLCAAKCISPILKTFNKKFRDIWLIGERKSEAKDNGYHLFKYIRENHSDDEVYYVIDKDSNDLEKIKDLGNIIYYDTFKHYMFYILSNKLICAHLGSCVPDSPVVWKYDGHSKKKKIFIQHGITLSSADSLKYINTRFDMFICGAKPEYDFVNETFGYPKNAVKYLGFPRFDNLYDYEVKDQILVMPTWRKWLGSTTWSFKDKKEERIKFIESDYFKHYFSLINDNKLNEILEYNNTKLIFYLHYEMQKYIDLFKIGSKNIIIADQYNYDVQDLLKESKLLITDYSSVAFDFAYMDKPLIYYQFDQKEYYHNHYNKGYFTYENDGFGPIVHNKDDLINKIKHYIGNGYNNLEIINTQNKFFILRDRENCRRNYIEIKDV